jgi:preprotein translocase subunit SecE
MATTIRPRSARRQAGPDLVRFFRETFDELRKVSWPTPAELYRYTLIVLVTVVVLGAFIGGIDQGLEWVAKHYIYGSVVGH